MLAPHSRISSPPWPPWGKLDWLWRCWGHWGEVLGTLVAALDSAFVQLCKPRLPLSSPVPGGPGRHTGSGGGAGVGGTSDSQGPRDWGVCPPDLALVGILAGLCVDVPSLCSLEHRKGFRNLTGLPATRLN